MYLHIGHFQKEVFIVLSEDLVARLSRRLNKQRVAIPGDRDNTRRQFIAADVIVEELGINLDLLMLFRHFQFCQLTTFVEDMATEIVNVVSRVRQYHHANAPLGNESYKGVVSTRAPREPRLELWFQIPMPKMRVRSIAVFMLEVP